MEERDKRVRLQAETDQVSSKRKLGLRKDVQEIMMRAEAREEYCEEYYDKARK